MLSRSYAPLDRFIAPARPRAELWRMLLALALMALAFVILTQLMVTVLGHALGRFWAAALLQAMQGGRTAPGVVAILWGFLPLALALALALRTLHDRAWHSLFGPWTFTRKSLLWVAGSFLALQLVLLPLQLAAPGIGRHLTWAQQFPWVIPALIGILVQAGTEEALFRGYLLQQLAVKSRSPLVWMALPSALFAALHLDPDAGLQDMIWSGGTAFLFGLAAADLTARTGSLGPAIGLHAAMNVGAILMVGLYGRMDGLAAWNLVLDPFDPSAALPYLAIDLAGLVVAWLLARLVLRV